MADPGQEMLDELAELLRPQYPLHAKTAAEMAAELDGVTSYEVAGLMTRLVKEGKWARAHKLLAHRRPYVYWKVID